MSHYFGEANWHVQKGGRGIYGRGFVHVFPGGVLSPTSLVRGGASSSITLFPTKEILTPLNALSKYMKIGVKEKGRMDQISRGGTSAARQGRGEGWTLLLRKSRPIGGGTVQGSAGPGPGERQSPGEKGGFITGKL